MNNKQKKEAATLKALQAVLGTDLAKLAAGLLAQRVSKQVEMLSAAMMMFAESREGAVDAHGRMLEAARALDEESAKGADGIDAADGALGALEQAEEALMKDIGVLQVLARAAGYRKARKPRARKPGRHESAVGNLPSHITRARKAPAYGDLDLILEFLGLVESTEEATPAVADEAKPKDEGLVKIKLFGEEVALDRIEGRISEEIARRVSNEADATVRTAEREWTARHDHIVREAVSEAEAKLNEQIEGLQAEVTELASRLDQQARDARAQAKTNRQVLYEATMAFVQSRDRVRLNDRLREMRIDVNFVS